MTRSELRALVQSMTSDPNDTRFSQAKKNEAPNLGQIEFALESRALWKDKSYTLAAGDVTENLPSDFMWTKKVSLDGEELEPFSRQTLEKMKSGDDWTDDEGKPTHYIIDPEEGAKTIRPYPKYTNGDDKTLLLTYYPKPADMSADGDTPLNGSTLLAQFHIGIAAWASWLLLGYDPPTPETIQRRGELLRQYREKVNQADELVENSTQEQWRLRVVGRE